MNLISFYKKNKKKQKTQMKAQVQNYHLARTQDFWRL